MLETLFLVIIAFLVIFLVILLYKFFNLQQDFDDLKFRKGSQSVKYGKLTEQWIPMSSKFPYPSENFRFLGMPIDGLAFNEDKIVFCEFKTNKAGLSPKQKAIKELVQGKKVEWLELRMD
ncbi:MAG: endonuclease [Candidatus Diapherotrites archaeon]|nr:endonuclease [Candidatus Diapherotrites archaeon]